MRTPLFALLAVVSLALAAAAASSDPSPLRKAPAKKPASAEPAAAAATAPQERDFPDLTSGRYEIKLSGLVCSVCTRAIAAEVAKLDDVENAKLDLDKESLTLAVKPKHLLKIRKLKRALKKAAKRADLGTTYEIAAVRYIP